MYSEREIINSFEKKKKEALVSCIAFDLIGIATYIIPAIGEIGDIIWAPIAFHLSNSLFSSKSRASITAIEEILPMTDILPTFIIGWHSYYVKNRVQNLNNFILEFKNEREMLKAHDLN